MLYVRVVMDVVFSVCIVTCGAVDYGCFIMHMFDLILFSKIHYDIR